MGKCVVLSFIIVEICQGDFCVDGDKTRSEMLRIMCSRPDMMKDRKHGKNCIAWSALHLVLQ